MVVEGLAAAGPPSSHHSRQSLLRHVGDSLTHSAAAHACRGKVRLHVLFSTPRPAKDLYPFAHIDADDAAKTAVTNPVEAVVEHVIMTASYTEQSQQQGRLMYALECFLYTLPNNQSSLLYVSKLDSSGWGPVLLPKHLHSTLIKPQQGDLSWDNSTSITRVITQAFLSYFASLSHWSSEGSPMIRHISIHILARSQGAYLFPASNENKGKHILSDGALIKWWRSVMSSVVCGVRRRKGEATKVDARPFYMIPGYSSLESHELLPLPPPVSAHTESASTMPVGNQALSEAGWVYGHPYSLLGAKVDASLPPLPLSGPSFRTSGNNSFDPNRIASLLPHFPDDPKSRFIAELARDSYEHAAMTKRKANEEGTNGDSKKAKVDIGNTVSLDETQGQEKEIAKSTSNGNSSLIQKALREKRALDAVSPDEFWQRMGFRQECCAGNVVGVFVGLFTKAAAEGKAEERQSIELQSQRLALHHPIIPDLVRKHLMRDACDWSKAEGSRDLTKAWDEGVERAIRRKGGLDHTTGIDHNDTGRDIVYTDVLLQGSSQEVIDAAEQEWKSKQGSASSTNGNGTPSVQVNTLSVKRKKKI